jgi:hypothetical protein
MKNKNSKKVIKHLEIQLETILVAYKIGAITLEEVKRFVSLKHILLR